MPFTFWCSACASPADTKPFCSLTVVPCSYVIDRPVLGFLQAAALTSSHLIIDLCVIWKAQ